VPGGLGGPARPTQPFSSHAKHAPMTKSFLVLFSKKNILSYFVPVLLPHMKS
jgi:hypothetical protein